MSNLGDMAKQAGLPWCEPDGCPPDICGGPHHWVQMGMGTEILIRVGQDPAEAAAALGITVASIDDPPAVLRSDTTEGE